MLYALDTNILTELLKGNARIVAHYETVSEEDEIVTTTVSRFEILRGRFASILKAADKAELLIAQQRLERDEQRLTRFRLLSISDESADQFDRLRTNKKLKKLGRADLLVARVPLAHDAILVTRNTKDFANVPGLKVENWAD
jgi:tRNA(fMet)-specific endonuclease VapC